MQNETITNERQRKAPSAAAASPSPAARIAAATTADSDRTQTSPNTASYSASEGAPIDAIENFKIKCLASAFYHEDRELFFACAHRTAMFFVVASGTAALSPLKGTWPIAIPAFTTLMGLLDLVFDLSGKARLHATLRKQVYSVLADAGQEYLESLEKRLTLIYADEPPCMYAVNAVAYNRAMTSYGRPRKFLLKIDRRTSLVRHFWPFTPSSFPTYDEEQETAGVR